MLNNLMTGLALMASAESFIAIFIGLLAGIIIGAIPGLTADIAIILCLPITYSMEPIPAMLLLLGLYCGGTYGGSITAILINTPGTPSSAATVLDGYPLTQQGKPLKALTMALYASFFGGLFSALVLLFAAPSIAHFTQMFGPPEYFCIAVFGLSIIASISNGNIIKGLLGGLIGIFIALLGQDSVSGTLRFTFGVRRLGAGIPLIVTLVGLFAIAELLSRSDYNPRTDATRKQHLKLDHEKLSWAEIKRCLKTMTISSVIGTIVGAIPGTGGGIAAFISYDQAKKTSKYRDHFGHGEIEGVSATESANNATTGSTLIPLTTLGVPGDGCTAILLGAFMLQGMVPGPSMFKVAGVDMDRAMFFWGFEDTVQLPEGDLQTLGRQELPSPAGHILLYPSSLPGVVTVNMSNMTDVDGTNARDLNRAEYVCRKQLPEIVAFLRRHVPGYEGCYLIDSADVIGVRETRRFEANYQLNEQDIAQARTFEDWVVTKSNFFFDLHNVEGAGLDANGEYKAFKQPKPYTIPLRCFVPKTVEGILLNGRNISGTHKAHSSYRVMPIVMNMGHAMGIVAAMCVAQNKKPLELDIHEVQDELRRTNVEP